MSSSPVMVSLARPGRSRSGPGAPVRRPRQPSRRSSHDAAPARGCVHPRSADAYAVQQEGSGEAARDGADDTGREAPPSELGRSLGLAAVARSATVRLFLPFTRPKRPLTSQKRSFTPLFGGAREALVDSGRARSQGRNPGRLGARPGRSRTRGAFGGPGGHRGWPAAVAGPRPFVRRFVAARARRDREVVGDAPRRSHPVVRRATRRAARRSGPLAGRALSAVPAARLVHARSRPAPSSSRWAAWSPRDVHGKNHHVDGCFGAHVRAIKLRVADGRIIDARATVEPDLFRATIGGMGLTGHILEVEFSWQRVPSPWI